MRLMVRNNVLAGGNHGDIYIVSLLNGRSHRIPAHSDDVNTVAFADQTSHILYSGGDDGIIRVWDRRTLSEERPKACGLFLGHKHGIVYVSLLVVLLCVI
jgi:DDB1- and CUL4-associated factor 11